jgi:hypothetical protein
LFFKQKCIKINSYEFAIQSLNLRNVVYWIGLSKIVALKSY